jgi:hypothetical protein
MLCAAREGRLCNRSQGTEIKFGACARVLCASACVDTFGIWAGSWVLSDGKVIGGETGRSGRWDGLNLVREAIMRNEEAELVKL